MALSEPCVYSLNFPLFYQYWINQYIRTNNHKQNTLPAMNESINKNKQL